jgi:SAM-dependent methyltransferase
VDSVTSSTRALLDAARLPQDSRLLDVGCGPGASARLAASDFGLRVDAVDASAAVIERARAHRGADSVTWHVADIRALPFDDHTFDGVLCECVLSTAPRHEALTELARVLRPRGRLLISDVRSDGEPIEGLDDHALLGAALCVNEAWAPGELSRSLPRHGLEIERQWDRSSDVLRLIERIEGRMLIAASVAARLEQPLDIVDGLGDIDVPQARGLIAAARNAVEAGELGYFAALIRPRVDTNETSGAADGDVRHLD